MGQVKPRRFVFGAGCSVGFPAAFLSAGAVLVGDHGHYAPKVRGATWFFVETSGAIGRKSFGSPDRGAWSTCRQGRMGGAGDGREAGAVPCWREDRHAP